MEEAPKEEEKKNLQIKDCPLSMDGWMTVLSSEINRLEGRLLHYKTFLGVYATLIIACILGVFTLSLHLNADPMLVFYFLVFLSICGGCVCFITIRGTEKLGKTIKELDSIRNGAIASRIDSNETYKIWMTGW